MFAAEHHSGRAAGKVQEAARVDVHECGSIVLLQPATAAIVVNDVVASGAISEAAERIVGNAGGNVAGQTGGRDRVAVAVGNDVARGGIELQAALDASTRIVRVDTGILRQQQSLKIDVAKDSDALVGANVMPEASKLT